MLTVSTRERSDELGFVYGGKRTLGPPEIALVEVMIPPTHIKGEVEWAKQVPPDPSKDFSVRSISFSSEEESRGWFASLHANGKLLIFVHGFNVRYSDAVFRLAQIVTDLDVRAAPILFSWPSRGKLFSYLYDKDSATYSRDALENLLNRSAAAPEVKDIVVLAHSMGTWLTMEALRQSAIRNHGLSAKISNVILAAPDIDTFVFAQQYEALGADKPQFTLLVSRDDRALKLSRLLAGGIDRVGIARTDNPTAAAWLDQNPNVRIIDLSDLAIAKGGSAHAKFAETPGALEILNLTLRTAVDGHDADEADN